VNPGDVWRHRKVTTHCLANGHYVLVRPSFWVGFDVVETSEQHGSKVHHVGITRAEADLVATAYVATRAMNHTNQEG
jgi:hypothetical protein